MKWSNWNRWNTKIIHTQGFKLGTLILLVLSLTGCWYPLFNLDVALGEQLAGKLGTPILVMQGSLGGLNSDDLRDVFFVPRRNPPSQPSGFFVRENEFGRNIAEVQYDPGYSSFLIGGIQGFPKGPKNLNLSQFVTDYGNTGIGFISQDLDNYTGQMWFRDSIAPEVLMIDQIPPLPSGIVPRVAVSFEENRDNLNTSEDDVMLLDWDPITPISLTLNRVNLVSFSPSLSPTVLNFVFSDPYTTYGKPSFGYMGFSHGSDAFFFSTRMEDGSQKLFIWDKPTRNMENPNLLPIPQQVTGILSNGDYLAQEGSLISVYSPTGAFLYTVNLGTLRFNFERYDSVTNTWYSVFSRTIQRDRELRVEVYEIPTADFETLAF